MKKSDSNTRIFTLSSGPITHFSAVVAMKRNNFEQMFVLIQANIVCWQIGIFQLHYYEQPNQEEFSGDSVWLFVCRLTDLLLKEHFQGLKKSKSGTWMFRTSWCKVIKPLWLYQIFRTSLFLLTGRTEILNAKDYDLDCYLTSYYLHSRRPCQLKFL